jgi:hypothetical protein
VECAFSDNPLTRSDTADDLCVSTNRDALLDLSRLELRGRDLNEDDIFALHILQRARRNGEGLFAEFGR